MTAHEILVAKWSNCEFGIKQRVFNDDMPQASVQYILANPNYGNQDKINWLIECIDKHVLEVRNEINEIYNTIEGID
ncbi:MAG: hypothetical protein ACPGRW_06065 [Flavobacteriaceae bacterium]